MSTVTALRRRALVGAAIAGLAAATLVALPASRAEAHGGLTYPQTRTYACYLDGLAGGQAAGQAGNMLPTNPICQQALAASSYPFYNWYGNLLGTIAGQHQTIADGTLCAPDPKFAAFNTPSTQWPTTKLQSGGRITFQYAATVPHPGWWTQWITKDGWDPSQPIGWDDLEPAPFDRVLNPPTRSGGPTGPEYYWTAQLPQKTGRHVILSIWERTDSPESFYNCSDVVFDGGGTTDPGDPGDPGDPADTTAPTAPGTPTAAAVDGTTASLTWAASTDAVGVTGYTVHDAATGAVLARPTSPATTLSGLTPGSSYSVYVTATDAAGNVSARSTTLTFSSGTVPVGSCSVKFDVSNAWSGGFVGNVTISNESMTPVNGWQLTWTFTKGEKVTQAWNGTATQSGAVVTARSAAWNGTIAHHGAVTFGFMGSSSGAPGQPTGVALNGLPCALA
ncbi:cellulose-binding protein [Cellulomonas sp. H30R-01]|uniref:lytic polysaccharide monooxygenase n=1 Tax=Cellulomonas sp. H30R-01 TaxID=2704467 RepID=UPI00138BFF6A|nr:lytic polysaccharide monooxygenase [Cellulomonas sp. H30R-01]QHT57739.1 cellulose-binding protein [Cellulomonas sp. H30R-01]